MPDPHATSDRAAMQGRALVIAELLRLGHAPAVVAEAVKLADAGDADAALRALMTTGRTR